MIYESPIVTEHALLFVFTTISSTYLQITTANISHRLVERGDRQGFIYRQSLFMFSMHYDMIIILVCCKYCFGFPCFRLMALFLIKTVILFNPSFMKWVKLAFVFSNAFLFSLFRRYKFLTKNGVVYCRPLLRKKWTIF